VSSALALLLLAAPGAAPPAPNRLAPLLAPLARAHKGKVGLAVKNLRTGESYYYHADVVMPTASLIKVAVLIEAYIQVDAGKLRLADRITLREKDKVPGSGLLTYHFSEGTRFPLRDAVHLMMAVSDNTATNLILDRVGLASVNKRMASWGLPQTRINAKLYRARTTTVDRARYRRYGIGSTTAREMVRLFAELQTGTRVRSALKQAMLGHLKKNEDRLKFTRYLPEGTVVAHKDGYVPDTRTDAGILYTPGGPVALCVLTTENVDRRWADDNAANLLCARVARAVYNHFAKRK
jgi:beta-lactamase class A